MGRELHFVKMNRAMHVTVCSFMGILKREIKQMVERLVQNSKDGYLLNGLSADNALNKRSGAISKKFGHLKRGMGFEDRKHTFHSFRATFITWLMNAKADKTLMKKLVGHKGTDITYDL